MTDCCDCLKTCGPWHWEQPSPAASIPIGMDWKDRVSRKYPPAAQQHILLESPPTHRRSCTWACGKEECEVSMSTEAESTDPVLEWRSTTDDS